MMLLLLNRRLKMKIPSHLEVRRPPVVFRIGERCRKRGGMQRWELQRWWFGKERLGIPRASHEVVAFSPMSKKLCKYPEKKRTPVTHSDLLDVSLWPSPLRRKSRVESNVYVSYRSFWAVGFWCLWNGSRKERIDCTAMFRVSRVEERFSGVSSHSSRSTITNPFQQSVWGFVIFAVTWWSKVAWCCERERRWYLWLMLTACLHHKLMAAPGMPFKRILIWRTLGTLWAAIMYHGLFLQRRSNLLFRQLQQALTLRNYKPNLQQQIWQTWTQHWKKQVKLHQRVQSLNSSNGKTKMNLVSQGFSLVNFPMATMLETLYCMILWECFVNFCLLHSWTAEDGIVLCPGKLLMMVSSTPPHSGLAVAFWNRHILLATTKTTCKDIVNILMTCFWLLIVISRQHRNSNKWQWNPEC